MSIVNDSKAVYPVMALRGLCVFPGMLIHFDVGREKSVLALNEAMQGDQQIFLVAQRDLTEDEPTGDDLYGIGTIAHIRQVLRLPGDTVRVLVEGSTRGMIVDSIQDDPFIKAEVLTLYDKPVNMTNRTEALVRISYDLYSQYLEFVPRADNMLSILTSNDPGYIADYIAQNTTIKYYEKQKILSEISPIKRLEKLNKMLAAELEILQIEAELSEQVQDNIAKGQRDYVLREQLKLIKSELGEYDDDENETLEYYQKIAELNFEEEVREKLEKEVNRLAKQPYGSSEGAAIRNYLDACIDLPWNIKTKERVDAQQAQKILDRDHYGLEKVKERITEFIAVRQLTSELNGQIICLVGPPGVGKTSIATSIASCLNRKMARLSLGGVHDEADIRGHRKTYIGSMPGRIISAVKQAGSMNPLILMDEIDKMGSDYRGDPSAALLEVFDIEQNKQFRDHYLEIPFDLSDVMFITTANTTSSIPRALLDRMEVIELSSYTDEEKVQIAKNHLFPKQLKKHGLKKSQLKVSDDTMRSVISLYTRESGVRNLERSIATICRRAAKELVSDESIKKITVTPVNLQTYLGVAQYQPQRARIADEVGVVTGLAWTSAGGETLEVEANVVDGSGKLELTGNLGDVMKESAKAAMSYIRSKSRAIGVEPDFHKNKDIHVHFPEGAVPKDGPSAGIAVCTAMVSALTGAPVRRDIAMTGEITLRGRVLPIGGLKEKTMAALRQGVNTVIIPEDNVKDLEEIDPLVRAKLDFIPVTSADKVLAIALDYSNVQKSEQLQIPVNITEQPSVAAGTVSHSIRQ